MSVNCPWCYSDDAEETGKFDHTNVEVTTCTHDFQCKDCQQFFTVEYTPIRAQKVRLDSEEEVLVYQHERSNLRGISNLPR
jgi:transposase-like protein